METSILLQNRYKIIQALASGGFGETFLAEDTHMPSKRRCVIKQLKPINQDPNIYQLVKDRFEKEAELLEKLGQGNPQIPELFGYFEENGQFYLVQEWIEGDTLSNLIQKQGKLSETTVKEILIKTLPILGFIQTQHIIHRDIKPDNIILRQLDSLPVLIDFGAVKETMGTIMASVSGNSTSSIVIGTPGFMPSEQMAGRPLYSSDLYALGLTAIYLMTGKIPQELPTDPMTGEVQWQKFTSNISSEFAEVLNRSIQTHPRERFSTVQDMLNALQGQITTDDSNQISYPTIEPTIPLIPKTTPLSTPENSSSETTIITPTPNSNQSTVVVPKSSSSNNSNTIPSSNISSSNASSSGKWKMPVAISIIFAIIIGGFGYYQYDQKQQFDQRMALLEQQQQEQKEKEQELRQKQAEAEAKAKEEALAREEAEKKAQEEAKAREEAEAKAKEEALAREAAEKKAKEEAQKNTANNNNNTTRLSYRSACGDSGGGSTWYAVVGSSSAQSRVRNSYCGDAYVRADGLLQVASFTSRSRAQNFANALSSETGYSFSVR